MGLLERIERVIKSNINALLSESEDPEKMLNQLIIDMRGQYREAHRQVALSIADEIRINAKYIEERKQANDWQRKAILALKQGRDDLAREALVEKGHKGQAKARHHGRHTDICGHRQQKRHQRKAQPRKLLPRVRPEPAPYRRLRSALKQ